MEIHFCDLCNESVPEADLTRGKAFLRKGRVICATCDSAMGGHGAAAAALLTAQASAGHDTRAISTAGLATTTAAPPTEARSGSASASPSAPGLTADLESAPSAQPSPAPEAAAAPPAEAASVGGGGVLLGLLALIFAAGASAVLVDRIDRVRRSSDERWRTLERVTGDLERDGSSFAERVEERFGAVATELRSERTESLLQVDEGLDTLRDAYRESKARMGEIEQSVDAARKSGQDEDQEARNRLIALEEQLARMDEELRFYGNRIIELEESLRGISTGGMAVASSPGGGAGGGDSRTPAWQGLLADLASKNAGIRLDAIYALGETDDQAVVPHIIPMLGDVDIFVRMGAARILEKLKAKTAVSALIDVLEDPKTAVREAAMLALRKITSRDFDFDPLASETERTRKVKAWRAWWKKEGDGFLVGE